MNKFNLQEHEKNQILSMYKGLIIEQEVPDNTTKTVPPQTNTEVPPLQERLNQYRRNGCVVNGQVVPMKSTNPEKQFAIKQESTKTPGKFRYFFIDGTVGMTDETGKFQILPNKWKCETKTFKKDVAKTIEKETESEIPKNQKECQFEIKKYEEFYKRKRPMSQEQFTDLKDTVQACKNEFYGNWKFLSGGRKIDKILDFMSGGIGGPSKMGKDAKWRLN